MCTAQGLNALTSICAASSGIPVLLREKFLKGQREPKVHQEKVHQIKNKLLKNGNYLGYPFAFVYMNLVFDNMP